jgi:tricorn protease
MYDVEKKTHTRIDQNDSDDFSDLTWSHDSKWLAYVSWAPNTFRIVKLWSVATGQATAVTTDRFDSTSPAFSADGKWLFLISDRNLKTVVESPWGPNQPDPFLDKTSKIYGLALKPGERWPFQPKDELQAAKDKAEKEKKKRRARGKTARTRRRDADKKDGDKKEPDKKEPAKVEIDLNGIAARLFEVPVPPGNYGRLFAAEKAIFYTVQERGEPKSGLFGLTIGNEPGLEPKQVIADITQAELSGDGKKFLVRKADTFYIVDAAAAAVSDLRQEVG